MIVPLPTKWKTIQASVGEKIETPTIATSISIVPAGEDFGEVTVSLLVPEAKVDAETERRPITKTTIERDETLDFHGIRHPTIVPASDRDSATMYYLGPTDEELRRI